MRNVIAFDLSMKLLTIDQCHSKNASSFQAHSPSSCV